MENEQIHQLLNDTVKEITRYMNLECSVQFKEETAEGGKTVLVALYTPENARFLIGKNGQNLKALEHLMRVVVSRKNSGLPFGITVDVNDYKKERAVLAIDQARQAVSRVRNTRKAEAMEPMSAYERRIVHMELAAYPDIATESIGEEPQRRIVIKPFP